MTRSKTLRPIISLKEGVSQSKSAAVVVFHALLGPRSRNIEREPEFGGEECPPTSDAQMCNVSG